MSRVLKFRAWDTERQVMVYDFSAEIPGTLLGRITGLDDEGKLFVLSEGSQNGEYLLMQFTGLHDSKGKEIYEGDRIKFVAVSNDGRWKDEATGEVQYDDSDASFFIFSDYGKYPHVKFWNAEDVEVIGNIHENPDLLNEADPK